MWDETCIRCGEELANGGCQNMVCESNPYLGEEHCGEQVDVDGVCAICEEQV